MAFALSAKFALAGSTVKAPSSSARRTVAAATPVVANGAGDTKKYVNPIHVQQSRMKLRESYEQQFAQAAGVKLVPMKQNTAQKLASMVVSTMGRKEYIPKIIMFTKPSLVVGSNPTPGTNVDVCITASTSISGEHCKFDASGDTVTVCDLGSATGTFLNGTRLRDDECAILSPGMSVSLDVDRGITYEVVTLTAAETKAAAGPAPGTGEGWRSDASLEDRQAERIAWVAAWSATVPKVAVIKAAAGGPPPHTTPAPAPAAGTSEGWTSEASLEDRLADRIAWVAAWSAMATTAAAAGPTSDTASAPGTSEGWRSEASLEDRQAERHAWIATWKAGQ